MSAVLHIGLLVNPVAGLGGSRALKGSDGAVMRDIAANLPAAELERSMQRVRRALSALQDLAPLVRFSTWAGSMERF